MYAQYILRTGLRAPWRSTVPYQLSISPAGAAQTSAVASALQGRAVLATALCIALLVAVMPASVRIPYLSLACHGCLRGWLVGERRTKPHIFITLSDAPVALTETTVSLRSC
jgi:hypothetical protein